MIKINNKFLIVSAIIIIFSGFYLYFSNELKSEAAITTSANTASSTKNVGNIISQKDKIVSDTAFINTLLSLKKIKIDTSLFSNKAFTILRDNSVQISLDNNSVGRPNPFLLMGAESVDTTSQVVLPDVSTNDPTLITEKSVVLNGRVNQENTTSVYFEYGTNETTLDKTTKPAKQSLIGDFNVSVTGLITKTTYFARAAAKINGKIIYGEIINFTTN